MIDDEKFHQWLFSKEVKQRSLQQFWTALEIYQKEKQEFLIQLFGKFEKDFLLIEMEYIELRLNNWPQCNERFIVVCIPLLYKEKSYKKQGVEIYFKGNKVHLNQIGTYKLYFNVDGEMEREEFEWYS
ncbi:MAG TPA: hypothetical protein VFV38_35570 [Ktedonobacteraceae bacterium]|nr:hypothetical protein [Ktedonobacteraceae bacterium]